MVVDFRNACILELCHRVITALTYYVSSIDVNFQVRDILYVFRHLLVFDHVLEIVNLRLFSSGLFL